MRRRSGEGGAFGPAKVAVFNHPQARAAFYQIVLLALLVWLATEFVPNAPPNPALPGPRQSLALGWQPVLTAAADAWLWLARFGLPESVATGLGQLAGWIGPPEVYLNNRGLLVPWPIFGPGAQYILMALVAAVLAA